MVERKRNIRAWVAIPVGLACFVIGLASRPLLDEMSGGGTESSGLSPRQRSSLAHQSKEYALATVIGDMGPPKVASVKLEKLISSSKKKGIPLAALAAYAQKLRLFSHTNAANELEATYNQAMKLISENPSLATSKNRDTSTLIACIHTAGGMGAFKRGQYDEADSRYNLAGRLAEKTPNCQWLLAYISDQKGMLYVEQHQYKKAGEQLKKALDYVNTNGEKSYQGHSKVELLNALAGVEMRQKHFEEATRYAKKGMQLLKTYPDRYGMNKIYATYFQMTIDNAGKARASRPD